MSSWLVVSQKMGVAPNTISPAICTLVSWGITFSVWLPGITVAVFVTVSGIPAKSGSCRNWRLGLRS